MLVLLLAVMFFEGGINLDIGGGSSNYGMGRFNRLNMAYNDLIEIETQLSNVFAMQSTYGYRGTNLENLAIDSGNVPPHMVEGHNLVHVWGGDVHIVSDVTRLQITYDDLDTRDCINMVALTGADTLGAGIEMIRIGEGEEALPLPITPLRASEMCYDGVDVGWLFEK